MTGEMCLEMTGLLASLNLTDWGIQGIYFHVLWLLIVLILASLTTS